MLDKKEIVVLESNIGRFNKSISKIKKMYSVQEGIFKISKPKSILYDYHYTDNYKKEKVKKLRAFKFIIGYTPITVNNRYLVIGILEKNDNKIIINFLNKEYTKLLDKQILEETLICDHCNTKRKRRQVFLVLDTKTNKIMRLGKSCLQAFIPKTVDSVISLIKYSELFFEEDWSFTPNYMDEYQMLNFEKYIISCIHLIKTDGYHSRNNNFDIENQTRTKAKEYMESGEFVDDPEIYNKYIEFIKNNTILDFSLVNNISTFIEEGYFKENYDEQILFTCLKFLNQKVTPKNKPKFKEHPSQYIGEVGDKITINNLEYVKTNTFENMFSYSGGLSFIHTFKDSHENIFVYMGSLNELDIFKMSDDYDEYSENIDISPEDYLKLFYFEITCKVKKHEEYNNIKQTHIKNIKLIKKEMK